MSDIPEGYFVNRGSEIVELLEFRRQPNPYPGQKAGKSRRHSPRKKSFLILRDGRNCHYCKQHMPMPKEGGPNILSVEHIVPRSAGGSNEKYNLVLACLKCNNDRGDQYYKCFCPFCREARYRHEHIV